MGMEFVVYVEQMRYFILFCAASQGVKAITKCVMADQIHQWPEGAGKNMDVNQGLFGKSLTNHRLDSCSSCICTFAGFSFHQGFLFHFGTNFWLPWQSGQTMLSLPNPLVDTVQAIPQQQPRFTFYRYFSVMNWLFSRSQTARTTNNIFGCGRAHDPQF